MDEEGVKKDTKRFSGSGGIAEAGGIIPWLIIKIVQWATRRWRKKIKGEPEIGRQQGQRGEPG